MVTVGKGSLMEYWEAEIRAKQETHVEQECLLWALENVQNLLCESTGVSQTHKKAWINIQKKQVCWSRSAFDEF